MLVPLRPSSNGERVGWAYGKTKFKSKQEYYNVLCKMNICQKKEKKKI